MSWQRLECTTVGADLTEGQEARIADPLWLLGKQWTVGELSGEDAASPILVDASLEHTPVTRIRMGTGPASPVSVRTAEGLPLEAAVECEAVRAGPAADRIAAEASLQLWRWLDSAQAERTLVQALRQSYPLRLAPDDGLDPVGRAQLELLARRSVSARELHAAIAAAAPVGTIPGLPSELPSAIRQALRAWAAWYASAFCEPEPGGRTWQPESMHYTFQLAASLEEQHELQLTAAEYSGGALDWYSFDVSHGGLSMGTSGPLREHHLCSVPVPVRFAGQAASRFWEVENRQVWFGDIASAPEDLARAALAAFAAVTGDDWLVVPCSTPSGVLLRGRRVRVFDSFGQTHHIESCAERDGPGRNWRFFELTDDATTGAAALRPHGSPPTAARSSASRSEPWQVEPASPWLFLAPALAGRCESSAIEQVALLRDETANLGWAVELRVESAAGRSIDRSARAAPEREVPPSDGGAWQYQLATQVPAHHIPLVPIRTPSGGLALRRGRLAHVVDAEGIESRGALGTILQPGRPLSIHDSQIPSTGATVTRSWQMARSPDGGMVVWIGRRKSAGQPRRPAALTFDTVLQPRRDE